ncbi:GARP complex subunit (Sac2) [Sporothrix brasiliensis 5110]|uniref:GARP complex subunit (Sac2) n=1 Tax=Sporothrix brasiliensis 5110 TaxID=1398154 RepID=A0A0C2ERD6_9PEZI|nr:GARP complex subunit (Sac2) [Sporothrix brasiliensis 5110]KIH88949.1 GARP complex subunit (Sac2) [Sporothrix brasiliensis 5110]
MWLDRLGHAGGGTSPQSNGNRSGSPLPRRPSSASRGPYMTSQRPARGSSLSLVSNDSTTSLLASRRQNGSSLKQSTSAKSVTGDPRAQDTAALALLGRLIGASPKDSGVEGPAENQDEVIITDEDLEADFDFSGLTLREIAWEVPVQRRGSLQASRTSEDLDKDQAKLEDLHKSIRACDEILNSVETNLTSFRNDLGLVSADIENLQSRSTALNVRLDNRKAVEKGLFPAVEDLSVSPDLVHKIVDGHIDEQWVQCLKEVDKRTASLRSSTNIQQPGDRQQGSNLIKAATDLLPLLDKLVLKAIERIRDFLVAQIKALRSPHINAQIIQQQSFIKFKDLFTFLHKHHAVLADEICLAYMNTMRWYYSNQFARYAKSLEKLKMHILDKNDVLGHDDHLSRRSAAKVSGPPHDAFSLGRRIDLLKGPNQVALSSYMAEDDKSTHYLEVPFRHFNLALVDNATAEYSFMASFFSPALSFSTIARHFNYTFEPTFQLGQTLTRGLIGETYDCLGVLLCIRLNQHFAFELQRRKIPAVDGYNNATNMLLWPRFQVIMDHHCESMHSLAGSGNSTILASGNAGGGGSAAAASAAPHVVTQRFGQLLHGILALSTEAGDDEPVVTSMLRLRNEVEAFLTKYSQVCFGKDKRRRERFLYNNYSLVLTIISDVHGGKLAAEQKQHIEALKMAFQEGA